MKCCVEKDKECNNENLSKCKDCIAPSWCFCTRKGANMGQSLITSHSSERQKIAADYASALDCRLSNGGCEDEY